jgi:Protein of unknown function (DUF2997)
MEIQEIEVFIDADGQVEVRVHGVKGTSCLDITRPLEEALGGEVELREMTPDAEETLSDEVQDRQRQQGR